MYQRLRYLFKSEKGIAIVLVSVCMVAFMGFVALVTDVGMLMLKKQQLVNSIDAAVLAGAQELPGNPVQAIGVARDYVARNSIDPDELTINVSANGKSITISGNKTVEMIFAKCLGFNTETVSASATADVEGITSFTGIVPVTISDREMSGVSFGQLLTLKYTNTELGPGNFGGLALGGNGANTYRDNLCNGYSGKLRVGDRVDTEPGNMAGPTTQGFEERIARCHDRCTFTNYLHGCPRIVVIPIHQYDPNIHGRYTVTIVGFAAFFLDDADSKGEISGYFIRSIDEGEASPYQTDFGLRAVRLIH